MAERIGEGPQPSGVEGEPDIQRYEEFTKAMNEEERLLREMDEFLKSAPDMLKAEKQACEKFVPAINEARRRTSAALREWLAAVKADSDQEER